MADWWTSFFDLTYAKGDLLPGTEEAARSVAERANWLMGLLDLAPGRLLLDQCSGLGRMSLAFGRLGVRTIGVEQNEQYVEEARRLAAAEGLPCRFLRGDAFETKAPEPCDAGLNWFTSFGYAEDDDRNLEMLRRMWESLRPGGRFVLDMLSVPRLLSGFREAQIRRPSFEGGGGLLVLDEAAIDWRRGMLRSTWTWIWPDGRRDVRHVAVRMFLPHELARLLERAGFEVLDLLGHADGRPFERETPRLVMLARRA